MVQFIALPDPNCSPNAGRWAVVQAAKRKLLAAIVCRPGSSFTQLVLYGPVENAAKRRYWQIATRIHCRLRWKTESRRLRFRRSVAALTATRFKKPRRSL